MRKNYTSAIMYIIIMLGHRGLERWSVSVFHHLSLLTNGNRPNQIDERKVNGNSAWEQSSSVGLQAAGARCTNRDIGLWCSILSSNRIGGSNPELTLKVPKNVCVYTREIHLTSENESNIKTLCNTYSVVFFRWELN